jgi:hypothetical protein
VNERVGREKVGGDDAAAYRILYGVTVMLASGKANSCPLHLYLPLLERAGHRQKVEAEQMVTFE